MDVGFAWHTGSVPQKARRAEIHRFKNDPDCRLFLSTDSGSVGLNLQAANAVINLDLPWNPAKLEQRIARGPGGSIRHGRSRSSTWSARTASSLLPDSAATLLARLKETASEMDDGTARELHQAVSRIHEQAHIALNKAALSAS